MWHGDWSGADWVWMSIAMLLFWTALAVIVVWLLRTLGHRSDDRPPAGQQKPPNRPTARDILDERYARGELSDEEYRARRDVLAGR